MKQTNSKIKSVLFGIAVGDALGVPYEFISRERMKENPAIEMTGYGSHHQPPGTWSDDSSLTFCLAEALTNEFDLRLIAHYFVKWIKEAFWTPHGEIFDIGIATRQAINRIAMGTDPQFAGGTSINDNGNGSLMRILPLFFYLSEKPISLRFEITSQVSSITHGHIRAVLACFFYLEFARHLMQGKDKFEAYQIFQKEILVFLKSKSIDQNEIALFDRLLLEDISKLKENQIQSSGYVLHTLEASFWCFLTTDTFEEAALKAVNLGDDTDTTGAVTGGIAGLYYGYDKIPERWINQLARKDDVEDLANRLSYRFSN